MQKTSDAPHEESSAQGLTPSPSGSSRVAGKGFVAGLKSGPIQKPACAEVPYSSIPVGVLIHQEQAKARTSKSEIQGFVRQAQDDERFWWVQSSEYGSSWLIRPAQQPRAWASATEAASACSDAGTSRASEPPRAGWRRRRPASRRRHGRSGARAPTASNGGRRRLGPAPCGRRRRGSRGIARSLVRERAWVRR